MTLVQPTPIFGKTVLFSMRSIEEASLLRRHLSKRSLDVKESQGNKSFSHVRANADSGHLGETTSACQGSQCDKRDHFFAVRQPQRGTRYTTIYTTVTALPSAKGPSSSTRPAVSSRKPTKTSMPSRPTQTAKAVFRALFVSSVSKFRRPQMTFLTSYASFQIGPMGVCLEQKDTFRICSSASLYMNYDKTAQLRH